MARKLIPRGTMGHNGTIQLFGFWWRSPSDGPRSHPFNTVVSHTMAKQQVFSQDIFIQTNATLVERCFTELDLMQRWLNPLLKVEPLGGPWNTNLHSRSRFLINLPLWQPSLRSTVIERQPGLIVWQFRGFFQGCDRWECVPENQGTRLINRFSFTIPNPMVGWGFRLTAARWTQRDMEAQLRRLKRIAETLALLEDH